MTATISEPRDNVSTKSGGGLSSLWNRQLLSYPDNGRRSLYLAITVLGTIVLYYELYIQGAVATQIISQYGFSFAQFVTILVVGNAVGAFASLGAGLADRYGRANLVVVGLFITGLLIEFALPHSGGKFMYGLWFALLSMVEGVVLVATPALIRDFSPQVGRGAAMGFWTLGPVLGSLVVTEVSSHTLDSHPGWRYQFYLCGIVGLIIAVLALIGLRELSPSLRDQLMVSLEDKTLIEARARTLDPEAELKNHWRQMLRFDIVGSAFAIGVFLLSYYMLVAFAVIYFATTFGYSEARANSLLNWYWISNAIALVVAGIASDFVRVRKPFMLLGAAIALTGSALFAVAATHQSTGYYTLAFYFVLGAVGGGLAYVAWMAAFTETVERHNPAATATGLAVWGWILRAIVTAGFAILIAALPATGVLVDKGQRAQALLAKYPTQIATLQKIDPVTSTLLANPKDTVAQGTAVAEIAGNGTTLADVATINDLTTNHKQEIAALGAIDPQTQATLATDRTNGPAVSKALSEVSSKLGVSSAQALQILVKTSSLPAASLTTLEQKGPAVQAAVAALQKAAKDIPAADQTFLTRNASAVQKAQRDNPKQWRTWWWICAAGQVIFIPFIFVLAGRWSPKKAREDELEHERLAMQELAALQGSAPAAAPVPPAPVPPAPGSPPVQ